MKFLVDAQLPRRFANWLNEAGHDALHTLELPRKNLTTDQEVIVRAKRDGRIVVSKDADFVQSFLIAGEPFLLLISTGNISAQNWKNRCVQICLALKRLLHPVVLLRLPAMLWWCMIENECDAAPFRCAKAQNLNKTTMAKKMHTSRAALNRLLDENDTSLTLTTLASAAVVLGKKLNAELLAA